MPSTLIFSITNEWAPIKTFLQIDMSVRTVEFNPTNVFSPILTLPPKVTPGEI